MRMAQCHTDKRYFALGLCYRCYQREWKRKRGEIERQAARERYRKNPEPHKARNLRLRYGITRGDWNVLFAAQAGLCAICHGEHTLHVDHDHVTGEVRGLLCRNCNWIVGSIEKSNDPEKVLESMGNYLRERERR